MPPPPLPLVRTASLIAQIRKEHLVIAPVGGAPIFAELDRVSGGTYESLWLASATIFAVEVVRLVRGQALLVLRGVFRAASSFRGDPQDVRWVGPIAEDEAALAEAKIAAALGLPRPVTEVDEAALAADPKAYDGRWIRVVASWRTGLEHSSVAGLWFEPPGPYAYHVSGESRRTIVGRVTVAEAKGLPGFGHFGMWRGTLQAVTMEPPPSVPHDVANAR
ncbi:hypothetical protein [Nannocystis sp. SCPEA4]|uniref:hypothetical protein n=1 Tax=Nannocystis sp. SCPEA4 TaxID=2996787 RepID=UPI00226EC042|nr:hypothetical protein [Nannocystis sp. SCPEA4]MCY1059775.1 hypothetical protein [Nannocystis sp. SCPEA4]